MRFASWIHNHTRSVLLLLTILALGGVLAALNLPVALFPQVRFPRIKVNVSAGDQPVSRMEVAVTYPVEQALRAIPGARSVRSITSRGSAEVYVNFAWGSNMPRMLLEVKSQINGILSKLPPDTTFDAERMDPSTFPVLSFSLTSRSQSLVEVRNFAQYKLLPMLSRVRGVARVQVQGGALEEYRVVVDPARLQALQMTLGDVTRALSASNVLRTVGKLQAHDRLYLLISQARFTSLRQIRRTILRSGTNGIVRLDDVAEVRRATVPQWTRVTADGRDAVLVGILQQPGGNTVRIASDVKRAMHRFRRNIPRGIHIQTWYDQSRLIVASANSVRDAVLFGVLLAMIVLLVFLRNWKMTLIAAISVPAALSTTILLLSFLHMSFNVMTLGGMAAAVGLIIDDSIVLVEHITRRIRGGGDLRRRIIEASIEFTRPLAGSSAATIIIFAPLAFLSGVTGAFFKALSITMAAALFISFLIAWLAVPVLSVGLLTSRDATRKEAGRFTEHLHAWYESLMSRVLQRPWVVIFMLAPLLAMGYLAYQHVGSGFMPKMDEGGFILDYMATPGTSLQETDRMLREVEHILLANPAVDTYSRRTGLGLSGNLVEPNAGDFFVRLKPFPRPPIGQIMAQVRHAIHRHVPGLKIDTTQLMQDLIGDLTAVPQPIEVKIFSDHRTILNHVARRVEAAIAKVPGIIAPRNGIVVAGDALNIKINRVRAALDGMNPNAIARVLRLYMTGEVTTHVQRGPRLIGVRVWVPHRLRQTERDLRDLELRSAKGRLFPLKSVATITVVRGQQEMTRDNLKPMIAVTARISGRDLGSTIADVRKILAKPGLFPPGVYYSLGGLYRQQQIAFRGLLVVMISAILLVFLLLVFLYERFRVAIAMLAVPLLALAMVFVGLWATGIELNISSMMGMTMVVGIVTEVAIFFYSEYHDMDKSTPVSRRLIEAGKNRMRPIAMTTLAAILALLPLALGLGPGGASMQQPLAVAIITGLAVQLPLVLLVLPALLGIVHRVENKHPAPAPCGAVKC